MLKLFMADGVFYPATYGLGVGDTVDIVLVAGGNASGTSILGGTGGNAGQNSSFGSYAIAYAGAGARGANGSASYGGCGGGGGYVPGSPWQGGTGIATTSTAQTPSVAVPCTNGGGSRSSNQTIFAGDGSSCGGGCAITSSYSGMGGNGFGAGGGGYNSTGYYGGTAGQILYYSHLITASDVTNGIPITVGCGGSSSDGSSATYYYYENNTATGFTPSYYTKNIGTPLTGILSGVPTFSLYDGTFGFWEGGYFNGAPSGGATTHVKVYGSNRYVTLATAFPGCVSGTNNFRYPFYYCNGWYVQAVGSTTGTTVYAWDAVKVKAGTITEADKVTVTYGTTETPVGFNGTDMIMYVDSTHIRKYANWIPTSTTYTDVTLNTAITWTLGNGATGSTPNAYSHFIPMSNAGFYTVTFEQNATGTPLTTNKAITNYTTGAVTIMTYVSVILYYTAITDRVYYYSGTASNVTFCANLTAAIPSDIGATSMYASIGCTTNTINLGSGSPAGNSPSVKIIMGSKGFASPMADRSGSTINLWGYNGVPGNPSGSYNAGGAGGCCMITW